MKCLATSLQDADVNAVVNIAFALHHGVWKWAEKIIYTLVDTADPPLRVHSSSTSSLCLYFCAASRRRENHSRTKKDNNAIVLWKKKGERIRKKNNIKRKRKGKTVCSCIYIYIYTRHRQNEKAYSIWCLLEIATNRLK